MNSLLASATVIVGSLQVTGAQEPYVPLQNGQHLVVEGRLTPSPSGRLQFMAITTKDAFRAQRQDAPTHRLALTGYHDYALLYRHRGDAVTVSGTVITEAQSPYYLHGMLLKVDSIRTASGADLIGTADIPTGFDKGRFRATVTLPADPAAPWTYRTITGFNAKGLLACSSNGGGDVINCSCAHGTRVIDAVSTPRSIPNRILPDTQTVQFDVGNTLGTLRLTVACSL